jgi:rhodanese-related sulfurtransferase
VIENIPAREAWAALQAQPAARLCDVRTEMEWRTVGVPELGSIGKQTVFASWQVAPSMQRNAGFVQELEAAGLGYDDPIYFICRSGAQSRRGGGRAGGGIPARL